MCSYKCLLYTVCIYIYISMFIFVYILLATPFAADLRLESPRTRCLELHAALAGYVLARMAITLGAILEPLGSFGSLRGRLWVACGLHWVRQSV